jgi:ATP-dependent helicase Lhr and Lhr-like helicase
MLPGRERIIEVLAESRETLGQLPTRQRVVVERFFDPSGDQHLVIHSLFGARINRAWGLALRKRFCRGFNFELQAAATDNGVLISLGAVHSFELAEVLRWLHSASVAELLTQAMLDTPIFQTRLRWVASTALAIRRCDFNGRVPAQVQRNQTENLIARIFPDQLACLENLAGEREIPDHPLVAQALHDCLEDYLDLPGLERLLVGLESGRIEGLRSTIPNLRYWPRPWCMRRATASSTRPPPKSDGPAVSRIQGRAGARRHLGSVSCRAARARTIAFQINAAELATVLLGAGYLNSGETQAGPISQALMSLSRRREAVNLELAGGRRLWAHIERLAELRAIWPKARISPFLPRDMLPEPLADADEALRRLVLARLRWHGQIGLAALEAETGLDRSAIEQALLALQNEGLLHRVGQEPGTQWAPRRPAGVL